MAASATLALKAGACVRRTRLVMVAPDLRHPRRSQAEIPLIDLSEFGQPPDHAQQAGEMITHLGAYPSLTIGPLLDTHRTDIGTILRDSLASEGQALALYKELLLLVEGKSVMLEEYARQMVQAEELHAGDVDKMLRQPGEVAAFRPEAGQPV